MSDQTVVGDLDGSMQIALRNFFQLDVKLADANISPVKFTLLRNRAVIDSCIMPKGSCSFNLESYGNYAVIAEFSNGGSTKRIESKSFKFDGFGADPNERLTKKIAILGISRLALVVEQLLKLAADVEVTFFSTNPRHIGARFGSGIVKGFGEAELAGYEKWILMNGLSSGVAKRIDASGITFGVLSANLTSPLDEYLNLIPIGQLHALAHKFHLEKLNIGADFIVRYIRKRFGSVLPPSVDLSGARFAYGCISTVINKNAVIGKGVTIGQNVTIGGRNGLDPIIEDGVWIGAGAVVLGARIGANSTIGANAVVTKDLAAGSVVVAPKFRELTN